MSNLTGLLNESENAKKRLEQAIISGNYDEMAAIEKSQVELSRRIFFAKRDEYAARLDELRIEKQCALELSAALAEQLKTAAADVMDAKSKLYDQESVYAAITAKQYFIDNQLEQNRVESVRANAELDKHIKSRLRGISGENTIDLMENNLCEI
jgi:hypothetical protein